MSASRNENNNNIIEIDELNENLSKITTEDLDGIHKNSEQNEAVAKQYCCPDNIREITIAELIESIENEKFESTQIIIDKLCPDNFWNFMYVLEVNPSIKSIKIKTVIDPDGFDPKIAKKFESVVKVNTTLRDLDFGNTLLPASVAKPFIKTYGQFALDNLTIDTTNEKLKKRLKHYKVNKSNLQDVCIYLIHKYIECYKKIDTIDAKIIVAIYVLQYKLMRINNNCDNFFAFVDEALSEYKYACSSNLKFSTDLEILLKTLNEIKLFCADGGKTPIAFLALNGMIDDIKTLKDLGYGKLLLERDDNEVPFIFYIVYIHNKADLKTKIDILNLYLDFGLDINVTDSLNNNIMHYAALTGTAEIINALHHCGVDINKQNIFSLTPLTYAKTYKREGDDVIREIEKLGGIAPNFQKLFAKREMFYLFGYQKLISPTNKKEIQMGGRIEEAFKTLYNYFKQFIPFIDPHLLAKNKYNRILSVIKSGYNNVFLSLQEIQVIIKNMEIGTKQIIVAGCLAHSMGAMLERLLDGNYVFTLTERGIFLRDNYSQVNDKYLSVKQLKISTSDIMNIIQLIYKAVESTEAIAEEILFSEIPKIAGNNYVDHPNIKQAELKVGNCFFGNPLSLVYLEIMNEFGHENPEIAIKIFKEFTLFMRKNARNIYSHYADESDKYLMQVTTETIEKKENKFNSLFRNS